MVFLRPLWPKQDHLSYCLDILQPLTATHFREFLAHFVRTKPGIVTMQTRTQKQINEKVQNTAVSLQKRGSKICSSCCDS